MAFVLKKPSGKSKGVIVFTHKERPVLGATVPKLLPFVERVRERYVLGMHFGWYQERISDFQGIDFYLAAPGTFGAKSDLSIRHVPVSSRNFIPVCFRPDEEVKKYWDILCIARPRKFKRLDDFLTVVRKVYDGRPATRALLITVEPEGELDQRLFYANLADDYVKLFNAEERERFTLMRLKEGAGIFPLSSEMVAHHMQQSRIFALFSDQEGESRVVAEALLCGLTIVVKKGLRGGGRDYLNENNSIQFSSFDEAAALLIRSLDEEPLAFDVGALAQEMREDFTVTRLEQELKAIFAKQDIPFEGDWDSERLDRKLPGHGDLLRQEFRLGKTDDVLTPRRMVMFLHSLIPETPAPDLSEFEDKPQKRAKKAKRPDRGPKLRKSAKALAKFGSRLARNQLRIRHSVVDLAIKRRRMSANRTKARRALVASGNDFELRLGEWLDQVGYQGICTIPDFFSAGECAELRQEIDRLIGAFPQATQVVSGGADRRIFGAERGSSVVGRFASHEALMKACEVYLGTEAELFCTLANRIEALEGNLGSGEGWHRDSLSGQFKAIVYLNDVTEENGPFQYIRASHRLLRMVADSRRAGCDLQNKRLGDDYVGRVLANQPDRLMTVTGSAGTLLLADTSGIHRGAPLRSGVRYALTNYYQMKGRVTERRKSRFRPILGVHVPVPT